MNSVLPQMLLEANLHDLGDVARRGLAHLGAGPSVLVLGTHEAMMRRACEVWSRNQSETRWSSFPLNGSSDGVRDALLMADAVVWVTPVTAPLSSSERQQLGRLDHELVPATRWVVAGDAHLLRQLSDNPEAELEHVQQRLTELTPATWEVLSAEHVTERLAEDEDTRRTQRRVHVTQWLRNEAHGQLGTRLARLDRELESCAQERQEAHTALELLEQQLKRASSRWTATARRHSEHVVIALRAFLHDLAEDLPGQITAIPDRSAAREALPTWLDHVISGWLHDQLAAANAAVVHELDGDELSAMDLADATLLPPVVVSGPVPETLDWRARTGASGTVAGGLAMTLSGLWAPGILALIGGLTWSSSLQRAAANPDPAHMIQHARHALRSIGAEIETALLAQRQHLEGLLASAANRQLEDARAADAPRQARQLAMSATIERKRIETAHHMAVFADADG